MTAAGSTDTGVGSASPRAAFSREAAEVRKAALIEATRASLAERGLGAVSVRDVARRAAVSPGLLRHHFGSFNRLLAETYRDAVARVDETLNQALDEAGEMPEPRMRAFVGASFAPDIVDRNLLSAWLAFWGLVRTDSEVAAVHAQSFTAYRRRLEGLLADLARARGRPLDTHRAAIGISAMLDGLWLELCLDPSTCSLAEGAEIAWSWIEALIPQ